MNAFFIWGTRLLCVACGLWGLGGTGGSTGDHNPGETSDFKQGRGERWMYLKSATDRICQFDQRKGSRERKESRGMFTVPKCPAIALPDHPLQAFGIRCPGFFIRGPWTEVLDFGCVCVCGGVVLDLPESLKTWVSIPAWPPNQLRNLAQVNSQSPFPYL